MTRYLLPLALVLTLAGCGGGSDGGGDALDSTESVCDEFAAFVKDGAKTSDRAATVESIGRAVGNADQKVQDGFEPLQRAVGGSDSAFSLASDTFAQSCFDAGWEG